MTKKPIIPALTMLLTLIVLVHATALLVQQETAWWLVMDAACGVISLGLCALSLICRKRGGTKILWKIVLGLIVVQMLTTVALQFVPIEQNRYQLLFWGFMSGIQCALVNDMRENSPASVPLSMSHSMMLLTKIIFGLETAVLIFAVGMLICYGERSFYQAMELMGLCVMVMAQSILGMKQNEVAEALKRNEDAENQQKLTQAGHE